MFEVPGDIEKEGTHFENHLRLCFAWEDEANLKRGIERLSKVISELTAAR
jgi:DNA-binding transcriptional MocR family regulator